MREVLEVHLSPLPRILLGEAGPDGLRRPPEADQGAAAAEHPVDATQAAGDEAAPVCATGTTSGRRWSRVGDLRRGTEMAGAPPPPPLAILEGDDVLNPCGHRPRCANLVDVGPPVAAGLVVLPTLRPQARLLFTASLSHMF